MGGLLNGLSELLKGFNTVDRFKKEGFDYRQKESAAQAARDQELQKYQQANETYLLKQAEDVAAGQEGEFNPEDIAAQMPGQIDQARKIWLAKQLAGRLPERKSSIAAAKAYSDFERDKYKEEGKTARLTLNSQQQMERDRLRFERSQGRSLSPAEQQKLDSYERIAASNAAATDRRFYEGQDRADARGTRGGASSLRREFNTQSGKLRQGLTDLDRFTAPARAKIAEGQQPTASDQFALIYAFNKALDPTSVVREGEFANSRSVGAGVTDRAFLALEKLRSGQQLAPVQVREMLDTIGRARTQTVAGLNEMRTRYHDLAVDSDVDPMHVLDKLPGEDMDTETWQGRDPNQSPFAPMRRQPSPPDGGGATKVRVQQNPKTGEWRHSKDGGATWQPGRP